MEAAGGCVDEGYYYCAWVVHGGIEMRKIPLLDIFAILNVSVLLVYFFLPNVPKLVLVIPFITAGVLFVVGRRN